MMAKPMKTLELHYPMIQFLIIKNSKRHFSSHAGYLFMFKNGFGGKDVIFIIVAL